MSHHVHKILVATSLGGTSDHVVAAGYQLARLTGAELHLLHAYPLSAVFYGSPMGMATVHPYPMESEREQVGALLDEQLKRLHVPPESVTDKVLAAGAPHRLLITAAQELEADLIVVGASDTHSPLEPLLGSTADRVLRQAHVPVLVVREGTAMPPKRLLAPVDLSELCDQSITWGLGILGDLMGGEPSPEVETLFVLSGNERSGSNQFTPEQVERFAEEELERHTALLAEKVGWPATPKLRTGMPRHEIVAELEERPADLVVLGTHGRSGFERLLLGSVAADVARRASTSVLIVPPSEAREAPAVAQAS